MIKELLFSWVQVLVVELVQIVFSIDFSAERERLLGQTNKGL